MEIFGCDCPELQDAIENQEFARHDFEQASDLLHLRILRSPFNGVVVDRMLNPGDLAESGTGRKPILKIAQIDPLPVEIAVRLEAYGKLHVGMTGMVSPAGQKGRYPALITVVDSIFDAANGMFGVRLEMKNREAAIPGGIRCEVEFPGLGTVGPKRENLK